MTQTLRHALFALLCSAAFPAWGADAQPIKDAGPYVPSPQSVVADMLRYAEVGPADFVIDLGSGDGRIVLTAAKVFGARGFGVEIKEDLVLQSNETANERPIYRVAFETTSRVLSARDMLNVDAEADPARGRSGTVTR